MQVNDTQMEPDLVAFYDIRPGNGAGLFLQTAQGTLRIISGVKIHTEKHWLTLAPASSRIGISSYRPSRIARASAPSCLRLSGRLTALEARTKGSCSSSRSSSASFFTTADLTRLLSELPMAAADTCHSAQFTGRHYNSASSSSSSSSCRPQCLTLTGSTGSPDSNTATITYSVAFYYISCQPQYKGVQ